jgi:TonB-linked SusC/RagA family outer membrane protein
MYKIYTVFLCRQWPRLLTKLLLTMKLTCMLLFISIMQVSASGYAQMVNLNKKNAPMKEVINEIQKQTGYSFIISSELLKQAGLVTVALKDAPFKEALNQCFSGQPFTYVINNKTIIITSKKAIIPIAVSSNRAIVVTGKVTDDKGIALPGVNITIKGVTQGGTTTDTDGNFRLPVVEPTTTLVFSLIGMEIQEVPVNNRTVINIMLKEATKGLDEVVVVGYGTQARKDITGAVTSVRDRDLHERPVNNFVQALQGKAAGVYVTTRTGGNNGNEPGSTPTIFIRGKRSIDGGNDPLYVIDGIPITGGLNDINNDDIVSIDILKDASATAIYGSRGANGVVIVTTKRGKIGPATVSLNSFASIGVVNRQINVMNGQQFTEFKRESRRAAGMYLDSDPNADSKIFEAVELASIANGTSTDWQDLYLRNDFRQNHELNINGGSEKTKYSVSFGFLDNDGFNPLQDFRRYSTRINLDQDLGKRFKVGVSLLTSFSQGNNANSYNTTLISNPLSIPYDADGNLIFTPTPTEAILPNPLADLVDGAVISRNSRLRVLGSFYGEAKIVDGLTFRTNFGPDLTQSRSGTYFGSRSTYRNLGQNQATVTDDFVSTYTWENIVTYKKTFAKKHRIDLTGVYSITSRRQETTGSAVQGLPLESFEYYNLGAATTITSVNSAFIDWTILSYMGRANYAFDDRFLATFTIRADGSSRFGADHKWGYFPSAALAWNVMNEDFIKNIPTISNLKFRLSYGLTGNTGISPYQTQGLLSRTQYDFGGTDAFGYRPDQLRNNDLRWESTAAWNLGIDYALWSNRISGSIELYKTNTSDLLLNKVLPSSGGFNQILQNIGSTTNKGIEFAISTQNILAKGEGGFSWSTDFNFSTSREKITELSQGKIDDVGNLRFIGQPVTVFFDYKKLGIWQTGQEEEARKYSSAVGQVRLQDTDGNGLINANDRVILGTELPNFTGGITNRFTYKGFSFSALILGNFGNTFRNQLYVTDNNTMTLRGRYNNLNVNYWTPQNPTNDFPRPNYNSNPLFASSLQYFDGSFVKIKNLSLGYDFSTATSKKLGAKTFRVYGSVQDPFTFATYVQDYDGTDPEIPGRPSLITYTLGFNVSF